MTRKHLMLLLAGLVTVACVAAGRPAPRRAAPEGGPFGPGDHDLVMTFQEHERFTIVHVPPGYKAGTPAPVVLVFHGGGGNPQAMRYQTGMDKSADREGFVSVYPGGSGVRARKMLTYNAGSCCSYAVDKHIDDVRFTADLIDELARHLTIDRRRIYATGLSNGAMLSQRLGCELSDRIAAIAPVSGTLEIPSCHPERPVPVMEFHGMLDKNVPFNGGVGSHSVSKVKYNSVPNSIATWLKVDGCPDKPASVTRKGQAERTAYGPCRDGSEVILWKLEDGGHAWPGGETTLLEKPIVGPVSRSIQASDLMLDFFEKHPMPETPRE
jgi:polyhydroxybutyrate depolymerase